MFKKIKNGITLLFGDVVYLISYLVPKDKNLWVFGAWFGEKYNDNSKYLFEYVNKNHPEIRAIWLTKNEKTLKLVKEKGYEVYSMNSLKSYKISFKANIGIICNGTDDIIPYTCGRMKIIQTWHGTPLKKIAFDHIFSNLNEEKNKNTSNARLFISFFMSKMNIFDRKRAFGNNNTYIAPSEEVKNRLSSAFRVPKNRVKITGYPRNDVLFSDKIGNLSIESSLNKLKNDNSIGIYMPTFRDENNNLKEVIKNFKHLNSSLKELNTVLLIKLHYCDLKRFNITSNMSNIIFLKDEDINQDVYQILPMSDYLITDYSSVYFDYLLLDKPIIFTSRDIDDYLRTDREFYYNYNEVTPGPKAKNVHDLTKYIEEAVKNPNKYQKEREKMRKMFNKYSDDQSCKRVFEEIINEVKF